MVTGNEVIIKKLTLWIVVAISVVDGQGHKVKEGLHINAQMKLSFHSICQQSIHHLKLQYYTSLGVHTCIMPPPEKILVVSFSGFLVDSNTLQLLHDFNILPKQTKE